MSTDDEIALADSDMIEEGVPAYIEPESETTRPRGSGGRYSDIYAEAERLVAEGKRPTLVDAMEAIGVDLDRSVALHAWEAASGRVKV
jgi:hypothetical protein